MVNNPKSFLKPEKIPRDNITPSFDSSEEVPSPPESIEPREESIEQESIRPQSEDISPEKEAELISKRPPKTPSTKPTPTLSTRDEITLEVEKILSSGLEDAYRELSTAQKQEFKIEGEKTAKAIRDILRSTRVKVKKIFKLILKWLSILPGVSKFFLEQEAKIKAEKIVSLKKKYPNQ